MIKNFPVFLLCLLVFSAGFSDASQKEQSPLESAFKSPPDSAKPWVYWFWMNGNITKAGITADLEAMARVGIGGALIMGVTTPIREGRVDFMSTEWQEMFVHAVNEAARLGLKITMNNDDGWTGSGGPWNLPEQSMQVLTWSEIPVEGGQRFDGLLPVPPHQIESESEPEGKKGAGKKAQTDTFYRDIAVFAVPKDGKDSQELAPKVTFSGGQGDPSALIDGNIETGLQMPLPSADAPQFVQMEFAVPFTARSLTIVGKGRQSHSGYLEVSDDGKTFRRIQKIKIPEKSGGPASGMGISIPEVTAKIFRLVFDKPGYKSPDLALQEVRLSPDVRLEDWPEKAGFAYVGQLKPDMDAMSSGDATKRKPIINLTDKLDKTGRLHWDAPPGSWTILRLGHTSTGKTNHPATRNGLGLECDKLSREALKNHFENFLGKMISEVGPEADKSLYGTHVDSWEVGSQNWTPKFREEFQKRRHYDPTPYLPAMVGMPVDNTEVSERFLWDVRRTIADLIADNYFGYLDELAHKHGMKLSVQAYGRNGNFDRLQSAARADLPMAEFWSDREGEENRARPPASVAHQLGLPVVAAEAFTSRPEFARWQNHPASLKALGDAAFCAGVNRFTIHRWAMQPWQDRWPGMTFGAWGIHFERTVTWFEQSAAWLAYLARCQAMLQQGTFVADVCYLQSEGAPQSLTLFDISTNPLPPGYNYDGCSAEMLQSMTVGDGRMVLPSGMSYRVLVLPDDQVMTPELLRKISNLVHDGAHVLGRKPQKSPSLENYPSCDAEVRDLADELWGSQPGESSGLEGKIVGKGRLYWGESLEKILPSMGVPPDVEWKPSKDAEKLTWIHRRMDDTDIYFIANPLDHAVTVDAIFRVSGKQPELWNAETGGMAPLAFWQKTDNGRTMIPLRLEQTGSQFVVFRKPVEEGTDPFVAISRNGELLKTAEIPSELIIREASYGKLGDPTMTVDVTPRLASRIKDGKLEIKVWKDLADKDPAPNIKKDLRVKYAINGVEHTATAKYGETLSLPEKLSSAPPVAEVTGTPGNWKLLAMKPGLYELTTTSGRKAICEVGDLPPPLEVTGTWTVQFPPKLGAPLEITLEKLISWTEYAEPGVKYFSGTGTYHKTLDIPADRLHKGNRVYLDLGTVKELAEVSVNGHDLGVLWKPPFRIDITDWAKPGPNDLTVRVTNLWVNRLIGDELKPPYLKWRGDGAPAEWPDWLVNGGPVPETGRITFTTWHFYDKDSHLLESGLLGPVRLLYASETKIPQGK